MNAKYTALLPLVLLAPALPLVRSTEPAPAPSPATEPRVLHCQVPCGIYGDRMRIEALAEDAATIEKAMAQVSEMESSGEVVYNQIVRWVTTKDQHAQNVQDVAGDYWLAQRVKAPADAGDEAARVKYLKQLEHVHGIVVSAMKCKQTTDAAHVSALKRHAAAFSETYFSKEDLEHLKEHGFK